MVQVDFANYIAKAYKSAQQAVISAIYQEYQVCKLLSALLCSNQPEFAQD